MNEKPVLNTSDEAAKYMTGLSGWVDRHGIYHGGQERLARYAGCTHRNCETCGKPTPKSYTHCAECREARAIERYKAREVKEWDGETPLYADATGDFFFSEDSLMEYLEEHECKEKDLRLLICEPIFLRKIDDDYFCDELPEDGELPGDVQDAVDELNAVIEKQGPVSWTPGKYAVKPDSPED